MIDATEYRRRFMCRQKRAKRPRAARPREPAWLDPSDFPASERASAAILRGHAVEVETLAGVTDRGIKWQR